MKLLTTPWPQLETEFDQASIIWMLEALSQLNQREDQERLELRNDSVAAPLGV